MTNRKEQFLNWLRKDDWYAEGSADALSCRIQSISNTIEMSIYDCSSEKASLIRLAILKSELLESLDKKQRNEYAVSLSRYSDFAREFPPIASDAMN